MAASFDPEDLFHTPEVMFLPLAVPSPGQWRGLDLAMLARRLPDFLHQVLNEGQPGPTALLELQTGDDTDQAKDRPRRVTWLCVEQPPSRDEAFSLLPSSLDIRAVVTGELAPTEHGLRVEFVVYRDDGDDDLVPPPDVRIAGVLTMPDPVPCLLQLARQIGRAVDLPFQVPPRGLLTNNGNAFGHFLQGLDNAMLLSGDLEIAVPEDREALLRPFADALALDPGFGLALRVANATAAVALDEARIDREVVRRFLDRCYTTHPADGEACVAVAEQLSGMGDDQRALAWLEHAAHLDPPPPRGLESLGLLLARRGDTGAARGLWEKAADLDGHPDFFSHLAQLSFAEQQEERAFTLVLQGLRRLWERTVRAGEWGEHDRGAGVLLECLLAQLGTRKVPSEIPAALVRLRGLLVAEDRVYLGLCLLAVGQKPAARRELIGGLRAVADLEVRDRAVRALLQIEVPDFERRFAAAVEQAQTGRNPRACLTEFRQWLRLQDEFWPALFFAAVAKRRLGQADEALDLFAEVLEIAPGQPDVLAEMAELFDRRQNPKRALELVDEALQVRPKDPRLHVQRATFLLHLGRRDDARQCVHQAFQQGLDSPELRKVGRSLRRG